MPLKQLFGKLKKRLLTAYTQGGVNPIKSLVHVGSQYHGYHIPENFLNRDSICYLVGAGDDISFDVELKKRYDSQIIIIDPTPASKEHFLRLKESMEKNEPPPKVHGDPNYVYKISPEKLNEMVFLEKGVWTENTTLKFHDPEIGGYVSQSVFLFKDSKKVMELPVDRLSNLMKSLNHHKVDLVKLEIEGAEYTVIDTILKDKLDVKIILVEFDEVYHAKGISHLLRIKRTCSKLKKAGYVIAHSTSKLKRTFIRKDVYNELKAREKKASGQLSFAPANR
jgi:FkbM family methyltransferase